MPKRFCLKCKALFNRDVGKSYCPTCDAAIQARMNHKANTTSRGLGWTHQQRVKAEIDKTAPCWICGHPGTPTDPITADHTVPRAHGGTDSPLLPAHRSCNSRRGAQQPRPHR